MEIALAFSGMPSGPNTLRTKSLGGSETAAICMAKELRKLGHMVTVFCNLEPSFGDGQLDEDGIRWSGLHAYQGFVAATELDVIIGSRDPNFFSFPTQAKKHILWVHDLATHSMIQVFQAFTWNIDEVWTVSEYHKKQYAEVTGYPLANMRATRNGILDVGALLEMPRSPNTLLYAARPERGLINLVRPGGIMSRLPEYNLQVCFYDNWPEQLREFYNQLFTWAKELPNVEILGPKTQKELRQIMQRSTAYVYPTDFEEVSCIIARECIEQKLPIIYTDVGALTETIGNCGHKVTWDRKDMGSDAFAQHFADAVKHTLSDYSYTSTLRELCSKRVDLHWNKVAEDWVVNFEPKKPKPYSMCKSLVMDGDVFAAWEVAKKYNVSYWVDHITKYYPFVVGDKTIEEHYKGIYELEESKGVPERQGMRTLKGSPRYEEIKRAISQVEGIEILEYGCAEGPIILQLAQDFPNKNFIGIDIVETNIALCKQHARDNDIRNVDFYHGSTDNWPADLPEKKYDAAIIAEVLEHTLEPWTIAEKIEEHVILGGTMIITVPQGPWEWDGLIANPTQWPWRAHVWHVNKWMLREMFADKETRFMSYLPHGQSRDGRAIGNIVMAYTADHQSVREIDPLKKAKAARYRQSLAFCMIAQDEEHNILRCLKSVLPFADQIKVVVSTATKDRTLEYLNNFANEHPYVEFVFEAVQQIEAGKFGFDDARNASIRGIDTDWIFWIDSDEYLSGHDLRIYTRNNAFDSYAIAQHHFTCEPRGAPTQIDKPARMFRNNGEFMFFGKVHEHAEKGFNGGPGMVMMLNSIDIGHTGYVNEGKRRERFSRNFPLLKWDRECFPNRKIGKFLWFRDLYHQMAWCIERRDIQTARQVAEETIRFFKANKDDFLYIGSGPQNSFHYYTEAMKLLGRGQFVKVHLEMEGLIADYEGVFENEQEAFEVATKAVGEQIKKRQSGYWA